MVLMASFNCRISPRTSTVIFFDRSPLATAIVTSAMLRTWAVRFEAMEFDALGEVLPNTGHLAHLRLAAELAVGAHFTRDASYFGGEHAQLLDHGVDDVRRAQELALERAPVHIERHRLQQIAAGDRRHGAGDRGGRPQQIVDERVDRPFHVGPCAVRQPEAHARARLALPSDDFTDVLELLRDALIRGDDGIEGIADLARDAGLDPGRRTEKLPACIACSASSNSCRSRSGVAAIAAATFPLAFFLRPTLGIDSMINPTLSATPLGVAVELKAGGCQVSGRDCDGEE